MRRMRVLALTLAFGAACLSPAAWAQDTSSSSASMIDAGVTLPPNDGLVTDDADVLTDEQDARLEQAVGDYSRETGTDIAIVAMRTLSGADIGALADEIREKWSLGQPGKDNAIIILSGYESRDAAIDAGADFALQVPPKVASGIAEYVMLPLIRQADYDGAFTQAVDALEKHISGEYKANRYDSMGKSGGMGAWVLLLAGIAGVWAASKGLRARIPWSGAATGAVVGMLLTGVYGWWLAIPFLVLVGLGCDFFLPEEQHRHARAHRAHGHH
jgi:uncharacterized protein